MFTKSFEIFRLAGFPVRLDLSWFLVVVLIAWSLAKGAFPEHYGELSNSTHWAMGFAGALGLFISILLHELGHALLAKRLGLPIRGITLFIFGGVAEMGREPPSARVECLVAIAGPIVTLLLVGIFSALAFLGGETGWPDAPVGVLWYLAFVNAVVLAFNLIPAFPLDGGRVLRSYLWDRTGNLRRATRITSSIGSAFGLVLIALGVFAFLTGNLIAGLWYAFIGMFLRGAAQMSYRQVLVRRALEGEPISRFMKTDVRAVPPTLSVADFVEAFVLTTQHKLYPVMEEDRLVGCVTVADVHRIPREEWKDRTVADLATPCGPANTIAPDVDAVQGLSRMSGQGASRLVVAEGNRLHGIITLRDLLEFIALKVELDEDGGAR